MITNCNIKFKPLLAATLKKPEDSPLPLLVSPKLDGIRCLIVDGVAYSRSLKLIRNQYVQKFAKRLLADGVSHLDGELVAKQSDLAQDVKFYVTSSEIMSYDGGNEFEFIAFDEFSSPSESYAQRLRRLRGYVDKTTELRLKIINSTAVHTYQGLQTIIKKHLDEGYEGSMLRRMDKDCAYKFGRSTLREFSLVKVKPFRDAEAKIIGIQRLLSNQNPAEIDALGHTKRSKAKEGLVELPILGAFICETKDGVRFKVGTGFTDSQRILYCTAGLKGRWIKFKYQDYGIKEAPRSPVFLALLKELE